MVNMRVMLRNIYIITNVCKGSWLSPTSSFLNLRVESLLRAFKCRKRLNQFENSILSGLSKPRARSSARSERQAHNLLVPGSNPGGPTIAG